MPVGGRLEGWRRLHQGEDKVEGTRAVKAVPSLDKVRRQPPPRSIHDLVPYMCVVGWQWAAVATVQELEATCRRRKCC
eukprot:2563926-Amphidinium_carterae.1